MGVIYVKEGQYSEEEILDNNDNSMLFQEFLQILGEQVRLKGIISFLIFLLFLLNKFIKLKDKTKEINKLALIRQ